MSSFSVTSSFSDATCLADRARSDAWRGALLAVIAALLIVGTDFGGGGSSGTNATHTWEESCSTVALVAAETEAVALSARLSAAEAEADALLARAEAAEANAKEAAVGAAEALSLIHI